LRVAAAAVPPVAGTLAALPQLLKVFRAATASHPASRALDHAARGAGVACLLTCAAVLLLGTLAGLASHRLRPPQLAPMARRGIALAAALVVCGGAAAGAVAATHGHPIRFLSRQWHGFTHSSQGSDQGSHFATIGTGRYDTWRVALHAALTHPLGGLGQDNFADYYVRRRRTSLEPRWTHSLELRLLAHTGFLGAGLFIVFLVAAVQAARAAARRSGPVGRGLAGICLLPLVVWLLHGSVDWFWEVPALSGPVLALLAIAGRLGAEDEPPAPAGGAAPWGAIPLGAAIAVALATGAVVVVLGFPYLAVRELSSGIDARASDTTTALRDLARASDLNPLSATPARAAGAAALQGGRYAEAERRFRIATDREPGGWFGWLGVGLAASALGDHGTAKHAFAVAASINSRQPAVAQALARVDSASPLSPVDAFALLIYAH
jgi:hypothetical protein